MPTFLPPVEYAGTPNWVTSLIMPQGGSARDYTNVLGPMLQAMRNSDVYMKDHVDALESAVTTLQSLLLPTSRWLVIPGTDFRLLPSQAEAVAGQSDPYVAGTGTAGTDHLAIVSKATTAVPYRYFHCGLKLPWRSIRVIGLEVTSSRNTADASTYVSLRKLNRVGVGVEHLDPVYPTYDPDNPGYGAGIDGFVECAGVVGGEDTAVVLDGSVEYDVDLTSASLQVCIALKNDPAQTWDVSLSKVALNIVPVLL